MLRVTTHQRTWLESLAVWWYRLRRRWQALTADPAPEPVMVARPDLAGRRYPIPPERAHLYARAADETF